MGVSNELTKPETEEEFESLCHSLYQRMWKDPGCVRMGVSGQPQYGVDILGNNGTKSVGVQCKHYNKADFTIATVISDIKKVESANLKIEHLLFATTASSKSTVVRGVYELSALRRKEGKFTVSVDFWGEISGHIRLHPEIGRAYIRNFPGSNLLEIVDVTRSHLAIYEKDREESRKFRSGTTRLLEQLNESVSTLLPRDTSPLARGDEADPRVVASLDFIRDRLREGRSREAGGLLTALGDPELFADQFSKFRWHTNRAAVALLEGRDLEAAAEFDIAFELAPDNEKAHANRAYASLLRKDAKGALVACSKSLQKFPQSAFIWSLKINAGHLLGDPNPEREIPEAIRDEAEILFSRARLQGLRGKFPESLQLLKQCISTDGVSFEVSRCYLADALFWATQDPVLAHNGQLLVEQKAALAEGIRLMEPLEQVIAGIQSDHISLEVTNNVTAALVLLGESGRARGLAKSALVRHSTSEGLLRIRLLELDESRNIAEIRELTESRLTNLPSTLLGLLAEISANYGVLDWHVKIMAAVEASDVSPESLEELRALKICALWMAGSKKEAVDAAYMWLDSRPRHVMVRVLLCQMLLSLGKKEDAILEAKACVAHLSEATRSLEIWQLADLLFDLEMFNEGAALYSRLVRVPGADRFTQRLLICLVESDQRRRASDLFARLSPQIQATPRFRKIEANLARLKGDWARMRDLLALELKENPDNSGVALGYAGALYQLGDKDTLASYLISDPRFKSAPSQHEFELSKYQRHIGRDDLATMRLYRLYRKNIGDTRAASFYLGQLLLGNSTPLLEVPQVVGPGVAVHVRDGSDSRVIAIDLDSESNISGWPELVSPDSNVAKRLLGLKSGAKLVLDIGIGQRDVTIERLESLFAFVADKAHAQISASAVQAGPLWSVKVVKDDGKLDVETLANAAKSRSKYVQSIFENYRQHRFPIAVLAKSLGTDPVTLLLEWPLQEATLFVGIGGHDERTDSVALLRSGTRRYVLDLLTIAELVQSKAFESAAKVLGRPLVPNTVKAHLLGLIESIRQQRPSASLREHEGRLQIAETPSSYYEIRQAMLLRMLECVEQHCEVVATVGPNEITDNHRTLAKVLDGDTLDVLYLCAEREAVLVSEDGALRLLAVEVGVTKSMGIQPVLLEACDKGLYRKDDYVDAIIRKLTAGHDFVSVRADDMLTLAKRAPKQVSKEVVLAIDSFRKSTLDIISGVQVGVEFLLNVTQVAALPAVAKYADAILQALQYERPQFADEIHRTLARALSKALSKRERKPTVSELKKFALLLRVPEAALAMPRLTPIAASVRDIFK